jgi:hypothetical protein
MAGELEGWVGLKEASACVVDQSQFPSVRIGGIFLPVMRNGSWRGAVKCVKSENKPCDDSSNWNPMRPNQLETTDMGASGYRRRRQFFLAGVAGTVLVGSIAEAQESFAFVQTGEGASVTSLLSSVSIGDERALTFSFGFGTEEFVVGGLFYDSATVTLQTADGSPSTAILATVDSTGVSWAPASPGTVELDGSAIVPASIEFPSSLPLFPIQNSFFVTVQIPSEFKNQNVNLFLDLFDNGNSLKSLAWLGSVQTVPEPGTAALVLTATGMWCLGRLKRR